MSSLSSKHLEEAYKKEIQWKLLPHPVEVPLSQKGSTRKVAGVAFSLLGGLSLGSTLIAAVGMTAAPETIRAVLLRGTISAVSLAAGYFFSFRQSTAEREREKKIQLRAEVEALSKQDYTYKALNTFYQQDVLSLSELNLLLSKDTKLGFLAFINKHGEEVLTALNEENRTALGPSFSSWFQEFFCHLGLLVFTSKRKKYHQMMSKEFFDGLYNHILDAEKNAFFEARIDAKSFCKKNGFDLLTKEQWTLKILQETEKSSIDFTLNHFAEFFSRGLIDPQFSIEGKESLSERLDKELKSASSIDAIFKSYSIKIFEYRLVSKSSHLKNLIKKSIKMDPLSYLQKKWDQKPLNYLKDLIPDEIWALLERCKIKQLIPECRLSRLKKRELEENFKKEMDELRNKQIQQLNIQHTRLGIDQKKEKKIEIEKKFNLLKQELQKGTNEISQLSTKLKEAEKYYQRLNEKKLSLEQCHSLKVEWERIYREIQWREKKQKLFLKEKEKLSKKIHECKEKKVEIKTKVNEKMSLSLLREQAKKCESAIKVQSKKIKDNGTVTGLRKVITTFLFHKTNQENQSKYKEMKKELLALKNKIKKLEAELSLDSLNALALSAAQAEKRAREHFSEINCKNLKEEMELNRLYLKLSDLRKIQAANDKVLETMVETEESLISYKKEFYLSTKKHGEIKEEISSFEKKLKMACEILECFQDAFERIEAQIKEEFHLSEKMLEERYKDLIEEENRRHTHLLKVISTQFAAQI